MMTRRQFLSASAVGFGSLALAGAGGVALGRSATDARREAEWERSDGVDRIVLAATLAASSHNTQPWRFRALDGAVDLLGDTARTMGSADARRRELHVSLGCALANMELAARGEGYSTEVEFVSGSAESHFARVHLTRFGDVRASALTDAIPARRTNRGPYRPDVPIADSVKAQIEQCLGEGIELRWLSTAEERNAFTRLCVDATEAHIADAELQRDSHAWYRMRRSEAQSSREGITIAGANIAFPASLFLGAMSLSPSAFDGGWVKATERTHCGTAPAFVLIVAPRDGDRRAWVEAGLSYQRMQLVATVCGLATHPLSQALAVRDKALAAGDADPFAARLAELGREGEVVLAFRIGEPVREQPASLRRPARVMPA